MTFCQLINIRFIKLNINKFHRIQMNSWVLQIPYIWLCEQVSPQGVLHKQLRAIAGYYWLLSLLANRYTCVFDGTKYNDFWIWRINWRTTSEFRRLTGENSWDTRVSRLDGVRSKHPRILRSRRPLPLGQNVL